MGRTIEPGFRRCSVALRTNCSNPQEKTLHKAAENKKRCMVWQNSHPTPTTTTPPLCRGKTKGKVLARKVAELQGIAGDTHLGKSLKELALSLTGSQMLPAGRAAAPRFVPCSRRTFALVVSNPYRDIERFMSIHTNAEIGLIPGI